MKMICVVDRGNLVAVFGDRPTTDVSVDVLDYDNVRMLADNDPQMAEYRFLEKEIYCGDFYQLY